MIESGEASKIFPPNGNVNYKTTLNSDPRHDRRIAQKNLVAFDMTEMAAKKIWWKNFIVSQVGQGLNELVLEHELPAEAFRFYVAMPTAVYQHYVAKQGHKGFDPVREIASKPFPDCVILRQSVHGAELRIAEHARERYLGLSIGIEVEATRARAVHTGDIRMVHRTVDRQIAGGFTVRLTERARLAPVVVGCRDRRELHGDDVARRRSAPSDRWHISAGRSSALPVPSAWHGSNAAQEEWRAPALLPVSW